MRFHLDNTSCRYLPMWQQKLMWQQQNHLPRKEVLKKEKEKPSAEGYSEEGDSEEGGSDETEQCTWIF